MSSRREFLAKSIGFIGLGITSVVVGKTGFDPSKGIGVAKSKPEQLDKPKAYATCGFGMGCSGGGGQCGFGMGCSGGGGQCGFGMGCSGT